LDFCVEVSTHQLQKGKLALKFVGLMLLGKVGPETPTCAELCVVTAATNVVTAMITLRAIGRGFTG
jgi:hypothetical protein